MDAVTPPELLRLALSGRRGGRALFGPRASAIAGEIEGLAPVEVLSDPTKLAKLLTELQRGAGLDVVWVESGSLLELEAAGGELDWSAFPPRLASSGRLGVALVQPAPGGRVRATLETARRLRITLGARAGIGYWLCGPRAMARQAAGALSEEAAARVLVALTRECLQAGGDLLVVSEAGCQGDEPADGSPEPAAYARQLRPVVATARFFQALPVVMVPRLDAGWRACLEELGALAGAVPGLSARDVAGGAARGDGLFALAIEPGEVSLLAELDLARCVLVTTRDELTGAMALGEARAFLDDLRAQVLASSV